MGERTCKMNEVRSLVADGGDSERFLDGVEQFKIALNEFKEAHTAVQMLMPIEIKENETMEWYEP